MHPNSNTPGTPVIILSGFLGSGKTTLLLKLLEEAGKRGLRPGVLMNELGRLDIDGDLVSRATGTAFPLEKLLDGCICCTKKDEIQGAIASLLRQSPDLLLLELTGVANPEEIVEQLTEPELVRRVYLHRVITIVDAEHALEYNSIFASDKQLVRTLRGQIAAADDLIINKTDLASSSHCAKVAEMARKHNAAARMHYAVNAAVPLGPFFEGVQPVPGKTAVPLKRSPFRVIVPGHAHSPGALRSGPGSELRSTSGNPVSNVSSGGLKDDPPVSFSRIRTVVLPLPEPVSLPASKLERFIKQWGSGVLRAKGYLRFSRQEQTYLLQFAGKRFRWESIAHSGPHYLVLIGYGLEETAIRKEWALLV
ncbi:MAG: GTP-binding protein [Paenibacillus macerans]|nr:CobW family GTP-binding protein [Paenibacillus macerans]MDU7474974.1 GTP-binding protein [Paenibacillus macerans]MED4959095.1 GTP-binding protein [Paenibacillus macerans]UMV50317.1 GTP-binding protein [Paenibacillus macerans]